MGSVTEGNGLFIVSHQSHEAKRKPNVRLIVEKGERFLRYLKEEKRRGASTVDQTRKFDRNYILPVCGNLRISRVNEGHLQRVLNLSAQKGCLRQGAHRPSKGTLSLKTLRGLRNIE